MGCGNKRKHKTGGSMKSQNMWTRKTKMVEKTADCEHTKNSELKSSAAVKAISSNQNSSCEVV